jgi:hypothetical protein
MDGHINLKAYQAHETHSDFPDDNSVVNYFKEKLNTCNVLVDFIRNNVVSKGWNGNVAEIGSGNSKLLYRLDSENLLSSGYGIEVSESRHKLAERYKRISKNTNVNNINSDIMRVNPYNNLDLIIGVDTVFQLVAPMFESAEEKLLKWTYQSLRTGGGRFLISEIFPKITYVILKFMEIMKQEFGMNFPIMTNISMNLNMYI